MRGIFLLFLQKIFSEKNIYLAVLFCFTTRNELFTRFDTRKNVLDLENWRTLLFFLSIGDDGERRYFATPDERRATNCYLDSLSDVSGELE